MAEGELVQLYCYDLSGGMARTFSQMLLGRQIEAIWHTSIVVGALEHFYGGGINVARPGSTPFGRPIQVLDLGYTQIPEEVRAELLADLSERYTPEAYSLFHNNCNNFSDDFAQLLCGTGIPSHITGLPSEVLSTPFGQMIAPMLSGLEAQMRSMRQQAFSPTPAPTPAASTAAGGEAPAAAATAAAPQAAGTAAIPTTSTISVPPSEQAAAAAGAADQETAVPAAAAEATAARGAAGEGPALHAAEVEIEAAVAAGMMQEAAQKLHDMQLQSQGSRGPQGEGEVMSTAPKAAEAGTAGEAEGAAAGSPAAALLGADVDAADAKLAAELAVQQEFERLMAGGELTEHEAQALALEVVAAQQRQLQQDEVEAK